MSPLVKRRRPYTQRIAACACLFALLLIYAPMASTVLTAVTDNCCATDQCPIHRNRHHAQNTPAQTGENTPMDCCGHSGRTAGKVSTCSMSCCHDTQPSTTTAHNFLLTPLTLLTALAPLSVVPATSAASSTSLAFAPPAPPPKSLAS